MTRIFHAVFVAAFTAMCMPVAPGQDVGAGSGPSVSVVAIEGHFTDPDLQRFRSHLAGTFGPLGLDVPVVGVVAGGKPDEVMRALYRLGKQGAQGVAVLTPDGYENRGLLHDGELGDVQELSLMLRPRRGADGLEVVAQLHPTLVPPRSFRSGDVILRIEGRPVATPGDFYAVFAPIPTGAQYTVEIERNGQVESHRWRKLDPANTGRVFSEFGDHVMLIGNPSTTERELVLAALSGMFEGEKDRARWHNPRLPDWLEEGIAGEADPNLDRAMVNTLAAEHRALMREILTLDHPFHAAREQDGSTPPPAVDFLTYRALAVALVSHLRTEIGAEGLGDLVRALRDGRSQDEALKAAGLDGESLVEGWRRSVADTEES